MKPITRSRQRRITIVGDFIRSKRQELRISQQQLGQLLSPPVTTQFMSNIERGITPLPCHHIRTLSHALKVKETELTTLLEKEVKQKFMGKLGSLADSAADIVPSLKSQDIDFMNQIYAAYQAADRVTQRTFAEISATLLKIKPAKEPLESE